uniref:Rhomboid domain-containing protein n=1 Tax=Globodera pallida TaxID=36090 RepID=A0A183C055_GLOPA
MFLARPLLKGVILCRPSSGPLCRASTSSARHFCLFGRRLTRSEMKEPLREQLQNVLSKNKEAREAPRADSIPTKPLRQVLLRGGLFYLMTNGLFFTAALLYDHKTAQYTFQWAADKVGQVITSHPQLNELDLREAATKLIWALIGVNVAVFLLWRVPALKPAMCRYFTCSVASKSVPKIVISSVLQTNGLFFTAALLYDHKTAQYTFQWAADKVGQVITSHPQLNELDLREAATKLIWALIGVNVAVFLLWRVPALKPAMCRYFTCSVASKSLCLPMFLSMFSHRDPLHLLINMYVLKKFAIAAIGLLGPAQFMAMFLTGGVFGGLLWLCHSAFMASAIPSLGASGAICAVIGYICVKLPDKPVNIIFLQMFPFFDALYGILAFETVCLLSILPLYRLVSFDHAAHIGGLLFGMFYAHYGQVNYTKAVWTRFVALQKHLNSATMNANGNKSEEGTNDGLTTSKQQQQKNAFRDGRSSAHYPKPKLETKLNSETKHEVRSPKYPKFREAKAGDEWSAWQYYSGSCRATFDLPEKAPILPVNEAMAQCTREFSDISPLRGGNVVFDTLEGRPSANNFEESEVLQDWVTATEIMLSLVRLNTRGDELFRYLGVLQSYYYAITDFAVVDDANAMGDWVTATEIMLSLVRLNTHGDELFRYLGVLQSYYYAITDFAVGGRCKCNGHANRCVNSTGTGEAQLVCDCQHNTAGVDCQQCAPFFLDRPWRRATSSEANECLPCNCNGLSNREHYCHPCQCNAIGAVDGQCDERGQCRCKAGVGGQLCDRCEAGFYDFGGSPMGCKNCQCFPAGSAFKNATSCSPIDGTCACKTKVEGVRCDKCKPGHFHLSASNPFGCAPCFCFGHSSVCSVADGFYARNISSKFFGDPEGWTSGAAALPSQSGRRAAVLLSDEQSVVRYNFAEHAIVAEQKSNRSVYFVAPGKFIGDQRFVYGQYIDFALRVSEPYACTTNEDIMLIGANGRSLTLNLASQGNPRPTDYFQNYRFRIHADPRLQWSPASHEVDFISVLSNLSEIRIKGTFSRGDVGFMSQFSMGSATDVFELDNDGIPRGRADWVERCVCPSAYSGQFCQFCRPGHKRADPFGGPLTKCVPCQCNEHAKECDAESGKCKCEHNTAGDTCAQCARGFYGNALVGKFGECRNCNCPDGGPCVLADEASGEEAVICTECPEGYGGRKGAVHVKCVIAVEMWTRMQLDNVMRSAGNAFDAIITLPVGIVNDVRPDIEFYIK